MDKKNILKFIALGAVGVGGFLIIKNYLKNKSVSAPSQPDSGSTPSQSKPTLNTSNQLIH